ncbi:MAG: Fic family protein [Ilumatobacteraceae bacterium]|nr:Fic family protein [Ilumatobacteraceae bacterium]
MAEPESASETSEGSRVPVQSDASLTSADWPPVEYEGCDWVGSFDIPRRWQSTFTGPYEAAVVPEIAELHPILPTGTAALADEATAELARFDAEMGSEIAPFAAILLRSESAASSRIENLTASAKAVALAELGDASGRNATEIVANTSAMTAAIALADQLDAPAILAMHAALLDQHDPKIAGKWRDAQVWIGSSSYGPHTAAFVPPHRSRVVAAVGDLVGFMRRDDLPVLPQAAIAHAQFETIHPFPDGNGRTGRAIVQCLLRGKGLTRQVTVPVSAGLLTDIDRYFGALTAYRSGDATPIVERFAEASFDSVVNGRQFVSELRDIRASWSESITSRRQAIVWRALDIVFQHPVLDNALVQRELDVSPMGAEAAITELVGIGALKEITGGRRNRRYAATRVLAALDAFAERAGRRAS